MIFENTISKKRLNLEEKSLAEKIWWEKNLAKNLRENPRSRNLAVFRDFEIILTRRVYVRISTWMYSLPYLESYSRWGMRNAKARVTKVETVSESSRHRVTIIGFLNNCNVRRESGTKWSMRSLERRRSRRKWKLVTQFSGSMVHDDRSIDSTIDTRVSPRRKKQMPFLRSIFSPSFPTNSISEPGLANVRSTEHRATLFAARLNNCVLQRLHRQSSGHGSKEELSRGKLFKVDL